MVGQARDLEDVRAANAAFYAAFEARAAATMARLWEQGDDVWCTHPGWPTRRGWSEVGPSWTAILTNGQHLQFIVTDEAVQVEGDVGWVVCTENLLDEEGPRGTASSLNLFRRGADGRWRMVGHHASPVLQSP